MKKAVYFLAVAAVLSVLAGDGFCDRGIKRGGKRYALVIGNGGYAVSPLKNPVNDARDMGALLKRLNFEAEILTDAGKVRMDRAIRNFGRRLKKGGRGCFIMRATGCR